MTLVADLCFAGAKGPQFTIARDGSIASEQPLVAVDTPGPSRWFAPVDTLRIDHAGLMGTAAGKGFGVAPVAGAIGSFEIQVEGHLVPTVMESCSPVSTAARATRAEGKTADGMFRIDAFDHVYFDDMFVPTVWGHAVLVPTSPDEPFDQSDLTPVPVIRLLVRPDVGQVQTVWDGRSPSPVRYLLPAGTGLRRIGSGECSHLMSSVGSAMPCVHLLE